MPPAQRRSQLIRVGLALAVAVYLVYSSFGIAGPFYWGHHGYHGAIYTMRARTSLRQHMIAPATWTGYDPPALNSLYFHHPIGYHHILTALIPLVGDAEWVARSVAVVGGLFALWAIWAVARRMWGEAAALGAVVVFVTLPIITSFSVLCDPMLPTFACVLWGLNAYLTLIQSTDEKTSRRALLHAGLAYFIGGLNMWEPFFIAPFITAHAAAIRWTARGRAMRLPVGKSGKRTVNALTAHTVVIGVACVVAMGIHAFLAWKTGALAETAESFKLRSSPPSAQYVIDRHTLWLQLLYGVWPVAMGCLWLVTFLARVFTGRARLRDLVPLTFLYVNSLYVVLFAEGSSVHLYRVFFFSGFFTFAAIDLADGAARAARRLTGNFRPAVVGAAVGTIGVYVVLEAPHAYANLLESRVMMGTHGERNYNPEREKLLFGKEINRLTTPAERVILHYPHLSARKELWYYLDRSLDEVTHLTQAEKHKATWSKSVMVFDWKMLSADEKRWVLPLVATHPTIFFDHFTLVDLRKQGGGVTSYGFRERAVESAAYKFFVQHKWKPLETYPMAWLPGVCDALEAGAPLADPASFPMPPETAFKDARARECLQRLYVRRGDAAAAERVVGQLTAGLVPSTPVGGALGKAARVVAAGVFAGRLRAVWIGGGPEAGELRFVVERPGKPPLVLAHSPAAASPSSWQPGFVYSDEVALPPNAGALTGATIAVELVRPAPPAPKAPPPQAPPPPQPQAAQKQRTAPPPPAQPAPAPPTVEVLGRATIAPLP
jgi:hypothetical protein